MNKSYQGKTHHHRTKDYVGNELELVYLWHCSYCHTSFSRQYQAQSCCYREKRRGAIPLPNPKDCPCALCGETKGEWFRRDGKWVLLCQEKPSNHGGKCLPQGQKRLPIMVREAIK